MNGYGAVILAALLGTFLLRLVADVLNLRARSPDLPQEMRDVFDVDRYRRAQEYTLARTRFGIFTATFDLAVLLIFWFGGGFGWLDRLVCLLELPPIATGLLYAAALAAGMELLSLPFGFYYTFGIEERFGFNRTGLRTFVQDRFKAYLLALVLGGGLLAGLLALLHGMGPHAWLWCWGGYTAFLLGLQYVAPTWLMPLFNRFTPLHDGELKEAILRYTGEVVFPVSGIFVIDGSRRSSKANAFFAGFGKNRRIALYDTLIGQHTVAELVAILAHEVGHCKKKHVLRGMVLGIAQAGFFFWLLSFFVHSEGLAAAFYLEQPKIYTGLIFFGLLASPLHFLFSLLLHALSRRAERQADAYAAKTTGDPSSLVAALKKLASSNLSNVTPHPFFVLLNHSHPPILQRIRALTGGGAEKQSPESCLDAAAQRTPSVE
ncbi:MAG: M48 family metallopeptidase [Deltaproteobacteria bacterium]|nr:M48 family metallopeptidase [Deltaproteobacteria bacterium]